MTSQPELDLVNGLPTLTPTKDGESGAYWTLALSPECVVPNASAKTEVVSASIGANEKAGFFISPCIQSSKDEKFNVLENLMTRGSESWDGDERMVEYRKQIPTLMKLALANGMARLPEGYTMADLEKAKGVRWARKAGCRCGCSPAFSTPLIPTKDVWRNSTRSRGRGRWSRYESVNWMNATLVVKQGNTVVQRIARNPEAVASAIEVRPVNKEAYEQAEQFQVIVKQG